MKSHGKVVPFSNDSMKCHEKVVPQRYWWFHSVPWRTIDKFSLS